MKIYKMDNSFNPAESGTCFLIYGDTGVGKTRSFTTLPDPILIINTEPRDPRVTLQGSVKKNITIWEMDGFLEIIATLDGLLADYERGEKKFKSVCFDSVSFIQSDLKTELEDLRFEKETKLIDKTNKSRYNTLVDKFRIEQGDWGSLASMLKRITWQLNRLSKFGVIVVATATLAEYPSYNRDLVAAPFFEGKSYPAVMKGYFDFIGFVTPGINKPYPPNVSFISDGSFMSKSSSEKLNNIGGKGELNFTKILSVILSPITGKEEKKDKV